MPEPLDDPFEPEEVDPEDYEQADANDMAELAPEPVAIPIDLADIVAAHQAAAASWGEDAPAVEEPMAIDETAVWNPPTTSGATFTQAAFDAAIQAIQNNPPAVHSWAPTPAPMEEAMPTTVFGPNAGRPPATPIYSPAFDNQPSGTRSDLRQRRFIPTGAAPSGYPTNRCACWECISHWLICENAIEHGSPSWRTWRRTHMQQLESYMDAQGEQYNNLRPSISAANLSAYTDMHRQRLRTLDTWRNSTGPSNIIEARRDWWVRQNNRVEETLLSESQRALLASPLRWMLRKGGRCWSAEVECNGHNMSDVARITGMQTGNYSTRPDTPTILASSDATVDAEIKISCMRDGSAVHQDMALSAYRQLVGIGQFCATNSGHHVHVDATRLADLGYEAAEKVVLNATKLGVVCHEAISRIAATGYPAHRFAGGAPSTVEWYQDNRAMEHRSHLHGERLAYAARDQQGRNATVEYRLPNGTLEPIRAHAHIALALGLLDFGERCYDGDPQALSILTAATDRLQHAALLDEETAATMLLDALHLSSDSAKALAIAVATCPANDKHKRIWRSKTKFTAKQLAAAS